MAASVATRVIEDGPRNAILWVEGNNGGSTTGGVDLAYTQLILPSSLGYVDVSRKQRAAALRIDKIEWDVQTEVSMRVDLWWDATTPGTNAQVAYSCIGRANKFFREFGGLYYPPTQTLPTGGIGISTSGAPAAFAAYTLVIHLVKNGVNPA